MYEVESVDWRHGPRYGERNISARARARNGEVRVMGYDFIRVDVSGGIARLTLNRPEERNAMTLEMGREIESAVRALNADDGVRVVVVTGAGKAFSAGGNLKTLGKEAGLGSDGPEMGGGETFYRAFLSIRDLAVPSLAAVNGHAIGAGLCFAIACDLRVAHADAKLGMTFVKLGIHPGWRRPGTCRV
jgi:enoyl-CoA hydratase